MRTGHDGGSVAAGGIGFEQSAVFAEQTGEQRFAASGEVADGIYADGGEPPLGAGSDIEQFACGERGNLAGVVFRIQRGDGVRLFHIAAQLGKDLIVGDADGNGDAQLVFDATANLVGNPCAVAQGHAASAEIQPRFIQSKRLDTVGIAFVQLAHTLTETHIQREIRRDTDEAGAFLLGLPDGFAGFDAEGFCERVFGQDDAVPRRDIAADGDGLFANLRGIQTFNGSVIAVGVAMQNDSFHAVHLKKYEQMFLKSIIRGFAGMSIEKSSNRLPDKADDALYMLCGNRTEREKRGGRGWRNGQAAAHKLARGDAHVRRADAPAFAGCVVFSGISGAGNGVSQTAGQGRRSAYD